VAQLQSAPNSGSSKIVRMMALPAFADQQSVVAPLWFACSCSDGCRCLPFMCPSQALGGTPGFIEHCIPGRAARPPAGPGWVHEIPAAPYALCVRITRRAPAAPRR